MKRAHVSRRTILRGLGGVVIGLPLLEEMLGSMAVAAPPHGPVPVRAFNVFFGLGIPAPLQKEGFKGVMEPLKPLGDKLLIMRNVDHVRADEPGENAHRDGATAAFTAEKAKGTAKAGGPSIDQVVRAAHYPGGMPSGMVPTLLAGTFFRRDRVSRYAKSFGEDGTIAAQMQETPRELFERVFGRVAETEDVVDERRLRQRRSVLDSVVEQYKFYTGPTSRSVRLRRRAWPITSSASASSSSGPLRPKRKPSKPRPPRETRSCCTAALRIPAAKASTSRSTSWSRSGV